MPMGLGNQSQIRIHIYHIGYTNIGPTCSLILANFILFICSFTDFDVIVTF